VALRDKGVTYLNKHGRFLGPHELEVVDKKGDTGRVTAARFVIAVGGRPQPLGCPGGELAITSDDIFSLEAAPGKTCVVGAGYVALECAGFLRALGHEVRARVLYRCILHPNHRSLPFRRPLASAIAR
jgi:thioredoxin reductase (NADPH)